MHVCNSFSFSAKEPSLYKLLLMLWILVTLFNRTSGDEVLSHKGGFIFERIATNNLNQEFMSFTRQLDSEHLKPLIGNLQGLIQIHEDLCNRAQQAASLNSTKDGTKLTDHGLLPDIQYIMSLDSAIFSPKITYQTNTNMVCEQYESRLPEYRQSIRDAIHTFCVREGIYSFPIGIEIDPSSNTLVYKSTGQKVPKSLFGSIHYTNDKGIQTSIDVDNITSELVSFLQGQKIYLANCQIDSPMLKFYSKTPLDKLYQRILCEKPHKFLTSSTNDVASQFLYSWVSHACKRDHPVLEQHTTHAINEIKNILNHQFDAKQLVTFSQYFPELIGSAGALSDSQTFDVQLFGKPTDFLQPLQVTGAASKIKREIISDVPTLDNQLLNFDTKNATQLTIPQLLQELNMTEAELKNQIYVFANKDYPTESDVEQFLLTRRLDTHANVTFHLVREKRGPWALAAFAIPGVGLAVGFYFLIKYLMNLFTIDLGELMLDAPPLATAEQLNVTNGHITTLQINLKKKFNK